MKYEAKYKVLLQGLRLAEQAGTKLLLVRSDSELVTQLSGKCEVNERRMQACVDQIREIETKFQWSIMNTWRILFNYVVRDLQCGVS